MVHLIVVPIWYFEAQQSLSCLRYFCVLIGLFQELNQQELRQRIANGSPFNIFDVPGAFLQAKLAPKQSDERVLLKLVGDFVDVIVGTKVRTLHSRL